MIIIGMKLRNWGPYRGEHVLELGAEIYAVVASDESDPERSNWIGKTWLISAPMFALFGLKPKSVRLEDDWITEGESEGLVELLLSGGLVVERSRRRGKSTQLVVKYRDEDVLKQAAAQERICDLVGMTGEEFGTSCFVTQKQTDRLLSMGPTDRTALVGDWIGLGELRTAEEVARERLNVASAAALDVDRRIAGRAERLSELRDEAEIESELERVAARAAAADEELKGADEELSQVAEWRAHSARAERFAQIVDAGKALKQALAAEAAPDMGEIEALERLIIDQRVGRRELAAEEDRLAKLAHGEFDGVCPVTRGECPAVDHVRSIGADVASRLREAKRGLGDFDIELRRLDMRHADLSAAAAKRVEAEGRLASMRGEAVSLLPSADYIKKHGEPPSDAEAIARRDSLRERLSELRALAAVLGKELAELRELRTARDALLAERAELEPRLETLRESAAILGRSGAQREIAVEELAEIEAGANALLADSDVELRVGVRWGLEGQELARACARCGAAFPASRRVKECACGEPRGQHFIERLDLVPSSDSGAADDLAGLAFQLSVAAWLRARRETDWSVVFADEPFAACDKANGRAVVARLNAMVRGRFSFSQGFVVAHDSELMEALPARVEIIRRVGGEMSVEVKP